MNAQKWWFTIKCFCYIGVLVATSIWNNEFGVAGRNNLGCALLVAIVVLTAALFLLSVAKPPVDMEVLDKATREHMEKEVRRIMSENAPEAGTGCSLQCLPRTTIEVIFVIKLIRASDGESAYFFLGFDSDHIPRLFSMNKVEAGIEEAQEMPLPPFKLRIWNDGQQNKASIIRSSSRNLSENED